MAKRRITHTRQPERGSVIAELEDSLMGRVRRLRRRGELKKAATVLREACLVDEHSAPLWTMYGAMLAKLGRRDDAAQALRHALWLRHAAGDVAREHSTASFLDSLGYVDNAALDRAAGNQSTQRSGRAPGQPACFCVSVHIRASDENERSTLRPQMLQSQPTSKRGLDAPMVCAGAGSTLPVRSVAKAVRTSLFSLSVATRDAWHSQRLRTVA